MIILSKKHTPNNNKDEKKYKKLMDNKEASGESSRSEKKSMKYKSSHTHKELDKN